jgi:3-oxoacyl-[acyl-carrier protein] reductase
MCMLAGKVAVVTGASKGIGAAIAQRFGEAGARVVVHYGRDREGAERVVKAIEGAGGKAVALQGDLAVPEAAGKLFAAAEAAMGKLDVLVNNAGVYEFRPLEQIDAEHFRRIFDLNVLGLLLATREAVARMNDGGSVINISSLAGETPVAMGAVYCASKAAVDAITQSLAQELGTRRIRVNSLQPGVTQTEGVRAMEGNKDFEALALSRTPLGRIGKASDIAGAALFLASDESGWITGAEIPVTGGLRV